MDNFPRYSPTRNWRILEFWAKFLEFFVKILEFFSKTLEFFLKTLEFYNQGGLLRRNLEFYPSIFSFSLNFISVDRKFTSILVIMTKLLGKKVHFKGKTCGFLTILISKNFRRNYVRRELADLRVFGKFA